MKKPIVVSVLFIVAIFVIASKKNKSHGILDGVASQKTAKLYAVASEPLKIRANFTSENKPSPSKNEKTLSQVPAWCKNNFGKSKAHP